MSTPAPSPIARGVVLALLAAAAFGLVTPLIQRAGVDVDPLPSAALLYGGAFLAVLPRRGGSHEAPVGRAQAPRLAVTALLGAVLAPACLTWGLQHTPATSAALLLNFEAAFTALLAWLLFHEALGRRGVLALSIMLAGGTLLVLGSSALEPGLGLGAAAIVLATACWALDNTLARPLADLDPTQVIRWKAGLGCTASALAGLLTGSRVPAPGAALVLLGCGALGYGVSLRLYLLAQRRMGTARTASVFAVAPFLGAAAAWAMGGSHVGVITLAAAACFGVGVFLHLTEKHVHQHTHARLMHDHLHRHDDGHHDHVHVPPFVGEHSHPHEHGPKTHTHEHGPDLHHGHDHA